MQMMPGWGRTPAKDTANGLFERLESFTRQVTDPIDDYYAKHPIPVEEYASVAPDYVLKIGTLYERLHNRPLPKGGIPEQELVQLSRNLHALEMEAGFLEHLRQLPSHSRNPYIYTGAQTGAIAPIEPDPIPALGPETPEEALMPEPSYAGNPYWEPRAQMPNVATGLQGASGTQPKIDPSDMWSGLRLIALNAGSHPIYRQIYQETVSMRNNRVQPRLFLPRGGKSGGGNSESIAVLSHSAIAPRLKLDGAMANDVQMLDRYGLGPKRGGLRPHEEVIWVHPEYEENGIGVANALRMYQATHQLHRAYGIRNQPTGSFYLYPLQQAHGPITHFLAFVLNVPVQTPNGVEIVRVPVGIVEPTTLFGRVQARKAQGTKDPLFSEIYDALALYLKREGAPNDQDVRVINRALSQLRWFPAAFPEMRSESAVQQPPRSRRGARF